MYTPRCTVPRSLKTRLAGLYRDKRSCPQSFFKKKHFPVYHLRPQRRIDVNPKDAKVTGCQLIAGFYNVVLRT